MLHASSSDLPIFRFSDRYRILQKSKKKKKSMSLPHMPVRASEPVSQCEREGQKRTDRGANYNKKKALPIVVFDSHLMLLLLFSRKKEAYIK